MHDARIFDIQRGSFVDGPGIRTVLFFKGCGLRCAWCHNPESWSAKTQPAWFENRCVRCGKCRAVCPRGAIGEDFRADEALCAGCGRCADACPAAARKLYGWTQTTAELLPLLLADQDFFATSGGGVTFSGGECLLQIDALEELLIGCRRAGVHTAVDTAGQVPWERFERALPWTELFLYDVKCVSSELHRELTGESNERILENYRRLREIAADRLAVRVPVIPGANDRGAEMARVADFLAGHPPASVELLPYHRLGAPKAGALGMAYAQFTEPEPARMDELKRLFAAKGLNVR